MNWNMIRHFRPEEFGEGDPGVKINPELVLRLDSAREIAGIPFEITSGLRTTEHNRKIGGAPKSGHLTGHAADIRCRNGTDRYTILRALIVAGFKRVGIYNGHIHADCHPDLPTPVIWTGKSK